MKRYWVMILGFVLLGANANAQMLRYYQRREIEPPEYATLRLGPFYSNLSFEQSAGYRYTRSEGTGTDFLYGNERGVIKEDGSEFPLVSRIEAKNYLMISRNMDLDISFSLGYAHYPLETQDDEFFFDIAEEGASGVISMEFYITKYVRGMVSDEITYKTDYIDLRGLEDNYGGSSYEHLENKLEVSADWLMDETRNLGASLSRRDLIVMDEGFEDQESVTLNESVYYEQQLTAFLVLGGSLDFGQTDYEVEERPDSTSAEISVYANAQITDRTTAGASVGYTSGSSDDLEGGETESGTIGAHLSTTLTRELMHGVALNYGLEGGFSSSFDLVTSFNYFLSYEKERAALYFSTGFSSIDPQVELYNEYSTWMTLLDLHVPITRAIILIFASEYSVRDNGEVAGSELTDPEYTSDYDTLSVRLGTNFAVTRKIDFDLYAQHIDRSSDNPDLDYSRDIFAAVFTYSHAF